MSSYLVLWIAFSCPGGMLSGLIPEAAKPFACARLPEWKEFPRRSDAEKIIDELGPRSGARLFWKKGLRRSEIKVSWTPVVKFGD